MSWARGLDGCRFHSRDSHLPSIDLWGDDDGIAILPNGYLHEFHDEFCRLFQYFGTGKSYCRLSKRVCQSEIVWLGIGTAVRSKKSHCAPSESTTLQIGKNETITVANATAPVSGHGHVLLYAIASSAAAWRAGGGGWWQEQDRVVQVH